MDFSVNKMLHKFEKRKLLERPLSLIVIFFLGVISILGCSGGNDESVPTQDPTGIWSGSYFYLNPASTIVYTISGIVWDGRWMLFYDGIYSPAEDRLWEGYPVVTGSSMEWDFRFYRNYNYESASYHYGAVYTKNLLEGEPYPNNYLSVGFSMNYSPLLTEAGAALSYIDGNWSDEEQNGLITTLSVNLDGTVSGSDTNGCVYNGMIEVPDRNINIYKLNVDLSICGDVDGLYSGLGYTSTDRNLFRFTLSNSGHFIHLTLTRV